MALVTIAKFQFETPDKSQLEFTKQGNYSRLPVAFYDSVGTLVYKEEFITNVQTTHERFRVGAQGQRYLTPSGDEVPAPAGRNPWPDPPRGQTYERENYKIDLGAYITQMVIDWLDARNWQIDIVKPDNFDPRIVKGGSDPGNLKGETSLDSVLGVDIVKPLSAKS